MKPIKAYPTYQGSLDAERHREKQWRQTKQGAFESSMVSFEENKEAFYPLGVEVARPYYQDPAKTSRAYDTAYHRVDRNIPECKEVFTLIMKNRSNRQKSVWEMVNKIKKQSGVLKKTPSMSRSAVSTINTEPSSASSSVSRSKKKNRMKNRRKMRRNF